MFNISDEDTLEDSELLALTRALVRADGDIHSHQGQSAVLVEAQTHAEAWRMKERIKRVEFDCTVIMEALGKIEMQVCGTKTVKDYKQWRKEHHHKKKDRQYHSAIMNSTPSTSERLQAPTGESPLGAFSGDADEPQRDCDPSARSCMM